MPCHTRLLKYLARPGFEILFVASLVFPLELAAPALGCVLPTGPAENGGLLANGERQLSIPG